VVAAEREVRVVGLGALGSGHPARGRGEVPGRPVHGHAGVTPVCKTARQGALDALAAAKPGRRGQSPEEVELADAREEIERLRATVTEQAVALHLYQGKSRWD